MRWRCCFFIRIGIIYLTTFAVCSFLFSPKLSAQSTISLFGYVYDSEDGSPIDGAEVKIAGTSYRTITDDPGHFTLCNIPPGVYSVEITASGYLPRVLQQTVVADINSRVSVGLDKDIQIIDGITVVGKRVLPYGGRIAVIDSEEIARIHPRNVADILQTVEGVYIERAGLDGGQTQVRIRGSAPKHVLVLIDGHKINPSGSGVADLNTVPIEIVERVEIHKGGASAKFGPDALGGVINIITQQTVLPEPISIEGEVTQGRWHTGSHTVTVVNPVHLRNAATKFAFSTRESEGDFDYSYSVAPSNETCSDIRINNRSHAANYFVSGIWKPDESGTVRYSTHVYQSRNGLPGRASSQNPYAFREDDRVLANLHLERTMRSNLAVDMRLGFSRFEQFFCDREAPLLQQYETRFMNDIFDARLGFQSTLWRQNQLDWGVEFRSDLLDHDDVLRPRNSVGRTERRTYSAFFSGRQGADISRMLLFKRVSVDLALRYDRA
ncbi:MAG: TonB-dependent receptor plug domain-containing protein, partial [candidate division Zixibacteria bacterium]|nr:TonB-dependent receptor plug domain-containing protein [candidate division Zixibacteria bacterium]